VSWNINFEEDNMLPPIRNKPVLLKKSVIAKNMNSHPDVPLDGYKEIIMAALYNPQEILKGHATKPYYNFIAHVKQDKNAIVLAQTENTSSGYVEIVNLHWIRDKSVEQKRKNKQS